MDLKRRSESDLTRNRNMEEKQIKDDSSLARRLNEQTLCSTEILNHIQTLQSLQPNQQIQVQLRPPIQNSNTEAIANAALLGSTPNQVAPIVTGAIPDNPTNSKDWHRSFTEVSRHHSVQKIVQNILPTDDISTLLDIRMISLVAYARRIEGEMYEAANSREEYEHLLDEKVYKIHKELEEKRQKIKEFQMQQQVAPGLEPILSSNSSAATPNAVGKSKDFSNEKGNLEMIMQRRQRELFKITEEIKKLSASGKIVKERKAFERDHGKMKKELDEVSNKVEEFGSRLNRMKKMLELRGIFMMGNDPRINRKTPSEVANSFRECDRIEERRHHVREEVSAHRRNNQLKAANLNRGLVMDVDGQGTSKSDHTYDLTSLDEALPLVSHCSKRAPRMKRTLKLQDLVMNSMEENRLLRLAAAGLCSMDTTTAGENS